STMKPTIGHIMRDINAADQPRLRNNLLDFEDAEYTFGDFVAGWTTLAHDGGAVVHHPSVASYSALNIPASKNGLLTCGIKLPSFLCRSDVFVRPVTSRYDRFTSDDLQIDGRFREPGPLLTTTATPAGTITDVRN